MTDGEDAGWRFLPAEAEPSGDLDAALREGPAAFARALRDGRARIGAGRMAARLREMPSRPAPALRLLLAAPIQPQSLQDALDIAFAAVGLPVAIESVEGFAALSRRSQAGDPPDFVLMIDPSPGAEPDPALVALAADGAGGLGAPVALARFGGPLAQASLARGVDLLTVGVPAKTAFDRRFSASFGTILRPAAADALADAAGAWAARLKGRAPKLLVTDLDGTLWAGILGERSTAETGGAPPLHRAYTQALKDLSGRGFVLAVASRNEPADVDAAFRSGAMQPLSRENVAAVAAGWEDKAALVERVLADLGLGAEHAILIDDDPVNCAKVAARFPAMDVRLFAGDEGAFAAKLLADPLLLGGGAEAGLRAGRYRAKAGVDRLRAETPDVGAFLAALGTRLTFQPLDAPNMARAAELASRVNQFVLRDIRPNVLDLSRRRSPFDTLVRLDDAFGSHGIVGLMLASARGETLVLDNLYLSCRALERGVEDAMLAALADRARAAGLARIVGRVEDLPRNAPARAFVARVARLAADGSFDYSPPEAGGPGTGAPDIRWQDEEGETR
ncbi:MULTISPECIES: HAD-IIIC family phosphatase [unclassified Aureimonas]|uniref:HAD-IIIC family phosphatase n=1 Tax=unclassified Aureimonas TaxID=2615206 RepID=UPI0006F2E322|nr:MULTISPECIES: HAD-IIIC family phosphatase [unclassified Aureimonas]KQT57342.1 hypothetical protein ASG62_08345 [Aureimonas sp. Leaf427]KQT77022.1 hypothetical protein ASG54_12210 [Aureimonas sp. Leaf460]